MNVTCEICKFESFVTSEEELLMGANHQAVVMTAHGDVEDLDSVPWRCERCRD